MPDSGTPGQADEMTKRLPNATRRLLSPGLKAAFITAEPRAQRGAFSMKEGVTAYFRNPLKFMVRPERFELPTYRFVACCSIQLSYERINEGETI